MSNLYLIWQEENDNYDTFDTAIVCADSEDEARNTLPSQFSKWGEDWCSSPEQVTVELIGTAAIDIDKGVVLASHMPG